VSLYKIIVEVVEAKYDELNVMCSNGFCVGRSVTFRCHGHVELENKEYLRESICNCGYVDLRRSKTKDSMLNKQKLCAG
jgi:hypothetical protein